MTHGNDTGDGRGGALGQAAENAEKPKIEYPTDYTFKVMGQQEGFRAFVVELFERLVGQSLSAESVTEQPSSKGKYVSVSVTVHLHSEDQRRGVYHELHKEKRIVYYL